MREKKLCVLCFIILGYITGFMVDWVVLGFFEEFFLGKNCGVSLLKIDGKMSYFVMWNRMFFLL